MISERATEGFDYLLKQALKTSLNPSPEDVCEIESTDVDGSQIKEKEVVVLTISSYLFRIITFFYYTLNDSTKTHFARTSQAQATEMSDKDFHDAIGEFGNMFSGALNRHVGKYFPYVGLSTPNILEKSCADYIKSLDVDYIRHFTIAINGVTTFHASLCVCDCADLDFILDETEEEASGGELELF